MKFVMRPPRGALLHHREFVKFLTGQTVSFLGSEVTHLALPLTAVLMLQATSSQMGVLGAARNAPFLAVGLLAGVWVDRFRRRPILGAQLLTGLARLCLPIAGMFPSMAVLVLAAGEFLLGVARPVFNVNQVSLRQAITPDYLQGRMNASIRFLMWAIVPVGALLGGALGQFVGLWPTLLTAAIGTIVAASWLVFSPVRPMRIQPAEPVDPA